MQCLVACQVGGSIVGGSIAYTNVRLHPQLSIWLALSRLRIHHFEEVRNGQDPDAVV
jgi:hypothetical protein